jgi:hypothetical protein
MEPATHRRPEDGQGQQLAEERQEEQEAQAGQGEAGRQEVSHLAGRVSGFIQSGPISSFRNLFIRHESIPMFVGLPSATPSAQITSSGVAFASPSPAMVGVVGCDGSDAMILQPGKQSVRAIAGLVFAVAGSVVSKESMGGVGGGLYGGCVPSLLEGRLHSLDVAVGNALEPRIS